MAAVKFKSDFLHMDVLCVRRFSNYTLAGVGGNLFVYSDRSLVLSQSIFIGERVHSIDIKKGSILVKGGRQVCLVELVEVSHGLECHVVSKIQASDWVQVVVMFENQLAGLVTAHNFFELWDLGKEKQLKVSSCEEKCILYSCNLVGESHQELVIFAGTVFGDVLIWSPSLEESQVLQTLKGHNGAVFSVEVKPKEKLLATTSDDRSLKVWFIESEGPVVHSEDWKNSNIQLIHTLFGHTSRVWRSLILADCYLTISEDSHLIVWSKDGEVLKSSCLHQESGIRGLDYVEESDIITTGGEDGGINAFPLKYLLAGNDELKVLNLGQSMSTKACFTKIGIVCVLNGRCVMLSDEGEEEIYQSEKFSSYCLLEVSSGGDYLIMGSIKGDLAVVDANKKSVVTEERIVDGRIYSVHWLGEFLLTCGPAGRLDLWQFSKGIIKRTATMTLPSCKDRWTTCATMDNDKLIIGDRMGNLHVYKLAEKGNPVKSYRKIHSYLGVTDLMVEKNGWLSVGRDGTVKEFASDLTHTITCRLPMEWPWKIVKYKDDILILGFHSVSFIVWSMRDREIIASHECGGGHRSCDYKLNNDKLSFLYVKDKKVFVVDLLIQRITRIRSGFHGKEIICLKILQSDPTIIATGSEDTTLRISKIEKSELKSIEVLKTHVSSVRALCTCNTGTRELIVSAGGKGQIVVWEFDSITEKCREVVNHRLRGENQNWKSSVPSVDAETRIMCADIVTTENGFLIVAGCSDCHLRIFSLGESLDLSCTIPVSHCVLKVTILELCSARVLVSMGTDGRVAFWDITDHSCAFRLGVFPLHQSGINSFHLEETRVGKFLLVTGGDDNMVSMACVEIAGGKVDLRPVWETRTAHSCQITGIKIVGNLLITTSTDQRITVWKLFEKDDYPKVEFQQQYLTPVPDVQGMDAVRMNDSTVLIAVYGKGLEMLTIDIIKE